MGIERQNDKHIEASQNKLVWLDLKNAAQCQFIDSTSVSKDGKRIMLNCVNGLRITLPKKSKG